jgi:hypothetical protein
MRFLAACAAGALFTSASASAQTIISVNFDNNTDISSALMEPTDLAGAPGVRVGNWNPWLKSDLTLGDDGQTIIDSSGATVPGFTATINSIGWASRNNNDENDTALFSDVIDVFGANDSITASGIPYVAYDLYVYMYDDGPGRAGLFTVGSTTYYARGFGPSEGDGNPDFDGTGYVLSTDTTLGAGSDIDQGNYVLFSGLTGSSFTLDMDAINAGSLDRNKVAGIQIVAVPEPGTFALAGFGAVCGLLAWRRRRA